MKTCHKCGREDLPLSEFHRDRSQKDGHATQCKECKRAYHTNRYRNDAEFRARKNEADRQRHALEARTTPRDELRKQWRESKRKQRERDPEVRKRESRNSQRYKERLRREDPEKYRRVVLEPQNIHRRLRRIEQGLPVRKAKLISPNRSNETIPVEPLRRFFDSLGWTYLDLARRMGIDEARTRKTLKDADVCTVDWADRACMAMNVHLELLYDYEVETAV